MNIKGMITCLLLCCCAGIWAQERAEVELETTEGNIRIALYNETPQHRDNFLKLVRMQVYDSLLFHRVIKDFMIQGGDLNSKHALPGQRLGSGELDYTLEPEFRLPQLYHRRGVVAAAREPDNVNPEQRSGACQFYIVWGRRYSGNMMDDVAERIARNTGDIISFPQEVRDAYYKYGGTPHLDNQYTVFGEVIEGLDVVERIMRSETDKNNRPLKDIHIKHAFVVE